MADGDINSATSLGDINSTAKGIGLNIGQLVAAIKAVFPQIGTTATTATGGAATLPANPVGFFNVTDATGVVRKVPYYNV
jgi:hypothetical protein